MREEMMMEPTEVRKTTTIESAMSPPRVSRSEKVRPKRMRGGSEGRRR